MKRPEGNHPGATRLVALLALLSVVPLALLAYFSVHLASAAVRREVEASLSENAALSAVAIREEMEGLAELVGSFGRRPGLVETLSKPESDADDLVAYLNELQGSRPGIATAFLASPDGTLLAIVPATPSIVGKDFSFRDWYRGVTSSGLTYVSEAYESQAAGHPRVVAAATLVRTPGDDTVPGRTLGILVAAYDLGTIQRFVNEFAASQRVALTVTDQRGTLLASPGAAPRGLVPTNDPLVDSALRGASGVATRAGPDGRTLSAYAPIPGLGWTVTASVPERQALAGVGQLRSTVLVIAGLLLIALLLGLIFLDRALRARRRAEEDTRESEERYRLLVETAKDLVFTYGPDGTFTSLNAGFEAITGWKRGDWIGKPFAPLVHPDDLPAARERSARFLRGENLPPFELRLSRRTGGWVTVESVAAPMTVDGEVVQVLGIVRDVTERKAAEEEIRLAQLEAERSRDEAREAKDAAERANRAKSEFLSRMSHELRTPLNSVLGFGQLLEMDELNADQRESVEQILKGGKHLLDLINEVLDISRIEAGRLALSLETVSVRDALDEALDLVRPLAGEQEVDLSRPAMDTASLYVTADRQRLKQVILNLLSNGVKYNRPGGALSVRCRQLEADGVAVIEVTDQGQGIPAEAIERLFIPFDRLGAERTEVEGTGLGLALSKRLVEAMKGSMGVVSAPGRGSTFWVRLPLAQGIEDPLEDPSIELPALDGLPDGGARVLYVEDNAANLKLIQRILGVDSGIQLLAAMQGSIGLDLARQHHPDLILLDLHLPDIRGDEVLASLRADPRTRDIPVVMITADATENQLRKVLAAGARAYLTKPLDVRRLLETIREILIEGRLDHAG